MGLKNVRLKWIVGLVKGKKKYGDFIYLKRYIRKKMIAYARAAKIGITRSTLISGCVCEFFYIAYNFIKLTVYFKNDL